jgi:aminoglycoside phosphotransferase (APT) family kinase protein
MKDDTIDVRPDEEFDEDRLYDYLKGKLDNIKPIMTVKQFGGGAANLTYNLIFTDDKTDYEYVLRRPPLGPLAKSAHDMGREYKVLSVLHKEFPYAPKAFLYCDDPEIIGAPFFIMERKKGVVIRNNFPEQYKTIPDIGKKISEAMVDRLVELHKVDYSKIGLKDLGKPEGFIERQVHGWYKRWNNAKHKDILEMDKIYEWLGINIPKTDSYAIIHNDYKLDNIMFDDKDLLTIVSIFDWDMCTLGDPFSDLGSLLAYWYDAKSDPDYFKSISTMPTDPDLDFMSRDELIERYAKKSGKSVKNIDFYHVLGLFRLAVIIAQIYIRFVRGQTKDKRFEGLGKLIPYITTSAMEIIKKA